MSDTKTAFVLMPFTESYESYYRDIFRPALEAAGYVVARADDVFMPRPIMLDVQKGIVDADLVLCEMSERNPNVFYELGLSHAIGKPAILVSRKEEDIPFDLRHVRVIVYDYSRPGWEVKLKDEIATAATSVTDSSQIWPPPLTARKGFALPFSFAAAICYRYTKQLSVQFLLVKSDRSRLIFPKGRIDNNDPQEMAKRYAHVEGGVYGPVKAVDPIIYRHFKEEDAQEYMVGGFIIEEYSTTRAPAQFREPKWFEFDSAVIEVSQSRPFVYAQEMRRVLRESHEIIRERFRPIVQCAAMPLRRKNDYVEVLMITSLGRKTWILPKGNIGETHTPQQAAENEAFEEAGVKGDVLDEPVGSYMYRKDNITKCRVDVYPLDVQEECEEWPDRAFRARKWFSMNSAIKYVELEEDMA